VQSAGVYLKVLSVICRPNFHDHLSPETTELEIA